MNDEAEQAYKQGVRDADKKIKPLIEEIYSGVYQQGREDALYDLWNLLIGKYDSVLSLEELAEDVEKIKEQK